MKEQPMSDEKPMGQVIQIDEARIRDHLGEMVRGTVEETLNAMLDAEADRLCGARRYERNEARQDTRAGSYDRTLQTSAGDSGHYPTMSLSSASGIFAICWDRTKNITMMLAPTYR
jgi:Transposase, Mutator family